MKRSKGTLSKRSRRLKKEREFTVNDFLKEFREGERVALDIQPYYRSLPHMRYDGKIGVVEGKRGKAYIVKIRDGNAYKKLVVLPIHLKKVV